MARELLEAAADDGRVLGQDPATGHDVVARAGRYGPYVTEVLPDADEAPAKGRGKAARAKPRTASLFKDMDLATIDLDTALRLLSLPRVVGVAEDGEEITAQNGRYGPYLKKGTDSRSIETEQQLFDITLEQALAIYAQPKQRGRAAAKPPLAELGTDPVSGRPVVVKDGRFGPYVTDGETNATLRKDDDPEKISPERGYELLADKRARGPVKKTARKAAKKTTTRTSTTRKSAAAKTSAAKTPRLRRQDLRRQDVRGPGDEAGAGLGAKARRSPRMSRILVATVPVPAHTRFPLPVVARLVERGHEVLWFASRRFHEDVAAVGATPVPYGATRDYDGARLLEEFPQLAGLHGPRGIGRAYSDVFVGPRRLREAVREVLHEPAYAAAAARVGVELRQHDAAQEAAVLVERLAATREPVTRTAAPARAR